MKLTIYLKDSNGTYTESTTIEAGGVECTRALWNTETPNQHGTNMVWTFDDDRHIVLSKIGTLLVDSEHYRIHSIDLLIGRVYLDKVREHEKPPIGILFALGRVVITPGASQALADAGDAPEPFLERHMRGDWGEDLDEIDKLANYDSIRLGNRILSSYTTTAKHVRFWIITDADRATTTLLLPSEY
jgi:hypothetical protein